MKKILSILLALGLVLGMVVSAVPAMAQPAGDWTVVSVTVNPTCEFERAVYTINFNAPATLTQGYHSITVKFPAGTAYPATWRTGQITIQDIVMGAPVNVFGTEVTRVGDEVTFLVPTTTVVGNIQVVFPILASPAAGIINPPAGKYHLEVKTSRAPMSTFVKSGWGVPIAGIYNPYTITPTVSAYKWVFDFSKTYTGMAEDFVPPFQMCGQDGYGFEDTVNDRWVTLFDLDLAASPAGCYPCPNMSARLRMTARPTGGVATLYGASNATAFTFDDVVPCTSTPTAGCTYSLVAGPVILLPTPDPGVWSFDLGLHFSVPGTYTFTVELLYGGTGQCELGCADVIRTVDFVVHQNKDAFVRPAFDAKWNFFSTPLRLFDNSVTSVFKPVEKNLVGVLHWDAAQQKWFGYSTSSALPVEFQSLSTIEDGKGYMVRMKTSYETWNPTLNDAMWLFGHAQAYPPFAPFAYPVKVGWNMVGYTSLAMAGVPATYLAPAGTLPGGILGLTAGAYAPAADFNPGFGYWVYFTGPTLVVVP